MTPAALVTIFTALLAVELSESSDRRDGNDRARQFFLPRRWTVNRCRLGCLPPKSDQFELERAGKALPSG